MAEAGEMTVHARVEVDAEPMDPASLQGELSRLYDLLHQIDDNLGTHIDRISPVLRDGGLVGAEVKRPDPDALDTRTQSVLTSRIHELADFAGHVADNVQYLTQRVDL